MQFYQNQDDGNENYNRHEAIRSLLSFQLDPQLLDLLAEGEKKTLELYVSAYVNVVKLYTDTQSETLRQELRKSLYKDAYEKFAEGCDILFKQPRFRVALAEVLKNCTQAEQTALVALFPNPEKEQRAGFSLLATEIFSVRELCNLFGLPVTGDRATDEDVITPYLALGDCALGALSKKRFTPNEVFLTSLRARGLALSLYRRGFQKEGAERILRELLQAFPQEKINIYLAAMNLNLGQFFFGFSAVLQQANRKEINDIHKLFPAIIENEAYSLPFGNDATPLPVAAAFTAPQMPGLILNPGGFAGDHFFGAHALPVSGRVLRGDL